MTKSISFSNEPYSWRTISLIDFLNEGNIPTGWSKFFMRTDVVAELNILSEYLFKRAKSAVIYPPIQDVFRAFYITKPENTKVVLLAQDPYHNKGGAVGLCFSVGAQSTLKINPSLKNIYKEMEAENYNPVKNGNLLQICY